MASRAFTIVLKNPDAKDGWKHKLNSYIEKNNRQIIADIYHILTSQAKRPFTWKTRTRFPDFERYVIAAVCSSEEQYNAVSECVKTESEGSDVEEERGAVIAEVITSQLHKLNVNAESLTCFIRSDVLETWFNPKTTSVANIRNLSKQGFIPQIDKDVRRFPAYSCPERRSGLLWRAPHQTSTSVPIIGLIEATPAVVSIVNGGVPAKEEEAAQKVFD